MAARKHNAHTIPVFLPGFVAYVRPQDFGAVQALGRQLLDVAETAIAAHGDVETDSNALWASVAAGRAAIDVEHRAREFGAQYEANLEQEQRDLRLREFVDDMCENARARQAAGEVS